MALISTKPAPVPALLGYGVQFPLRLELFCIRNRLCLLDKRWADLRSSDPQITEEKDELALSSQQPPVSQCCSNCLESVPWGYAPRSSSLSVPGRHQVKNHPTSFLQFREQQFTLPLAMGNGPMIPPSTI